MNNLRGALLDIALEHTVRACALLASLMNDDSDNDELALAAKLYLEHAKSFLTQAEYQQFASGVELALAPQVADAEDLEEKMKNPLGEGVR